MAEFYRVYGRTIQIGHGRFRLVYVRRFPDSPNDYVGNNPASCERGNLMAPRLLTIIIILVVGYLLGVKFPGLAARFGLA